MITRRAFNICAASAIALPATGVAWAAPTVAEDSFPPLPKELLAASAEADFFSTKLDRTALGKNDPGAAKIKMAQEIINAAPKNCRPIDVAYYFRDLGKGTTPFGEEGRPYARGWPRLYNPLIIEFFKATSLNPLAPNFGGDATPWCAAFMNFCIARATAKNGLIGTGLTNGTRNASSGSFRCFGDPLAKEIEPEEGDIAVWALDGTVDGCKQGTGHVGFFVAKTEDDKKPFYILGGNQSGNLLVNTETRNDGIFVKAMPRAYLAGKNSQRYKRFFAFRTAAFL